MGFQKSRTILSMCRKKSILKSAYRIFNDLRNQLALAYEGNPAEINDKLKTKSDIDTIFRQAQKAYNAWIKLPDKNRTTSELLSMLDFDFFEVLDSVTIARSRKHIQNFYDISDI